MKLIDANILVYAIGKPHPLKAPSYRFIEAVNDDKIHANVDVEVFQEILNIYHRRGETVKGLLAFDKYFTMFPTPIPIDGECIQKGRDILEKYPHIATRDAIHIAVAVLHKLEGIVSADTHLDKIREIRRFDPRELAK